MSSPCNVREGPKSPSPACRNDADGCSGHASDSTFPTPSHPVPARLTEPELASVPSDIAKKLLQQDSYVSYLEERLNNLEGLLSNSRESEERLRTQHAESQQREKVLVRRLAAKEQEMQDVANQMTELKSSQATSSALRSALLDPAVNLLLQRLRHELATSRTRLDETQNELSAWKFTPDSNTGKRLMAKCRLLYTENEELGKLTNSGRVAKLEGELALQKSFSEEVKKSQSEMEEILQDLDEDVEGMQSTILYLQQELQKTKESAAAMESELSSLRTAVSAAVPEPQQQMPTPQRLNGKCKSECERTRAADSDSEPELVIKVSDKEMCDEDSRDAAVVTMNGDVKRTYDSDSSESNHRTSVKKVRRSSVLSYDDNMDDDALIISANGDGTISDPD